MNTAKFLRAVDMKKYGMNGLVGERVTLISDGGCTTVYRVIQLSPLGCYLEALTLSY